MMPDSRKPHTRGRAWRWARTLAIALKWCVLLGAGPALIWLRVYAYLPVRVISGSMRPTLHVGDFGLVSRRAYRHHLPRAGEIVAFHTLDRQQLWTKRVVAGPGDVVQVRDGALWRNGRPVEEPYRMLGGSAAGDLRARDLYLEDGNLPDPEVYGGAAREYGPARVPAGRVFVLGDNRDNSDDSRRWGSLSGEYVVGKVVCIYWPRKRARRL